MKDGLTLRKVCYRWTLALLVANLSLMLNWSQACSFIGCEACFHDHQKPISATIHKIDTKKDYLIY